MFYSNKNIFTVLRLYILILLPSALLFKEQSHVKISLFAKSSVTSVPWHPVHPKNSLNSLKLVPAKGDNNDKLRKTNDSGNKPFLKQIPSKNYIKIMCKVQGFLIFWWIHTELILLYPPYAEYVFMLLQYQLCLILCRDWWVLEGKKTHSDSNYWYCPTDLEFYCRN